MSPKEYTSINKIISKGTLEQSSTYSKNKNGNEKKRVSKDFRDGIFRNRIFEIYDNLYDLKTTAELVEEGTQRACKDLMVNRAKDLESMGIVIDIKSLVKEVKNKFPYKDMPEDEKKARNFYTATICDLVTESVSCLVLEKH